MGLHVNYRLFFSDLNQICILSTDFRKKNLQISDCVQIRQVGSRVVSCGQKDEQRERYD